MKDTVTMTETTTTNTTTERATITAGTRPGFVELAFTGKPDTVPGFKPYEARTT